MDKLEKLSAHIKRWNIEIDEKAAFGNLKNRVSQQLDRHITSWSTSFWAVFPRGVNYLLGYEAFNDNRYSDEKKNFLALIRSSQSVKELAHYFQVSFIVIENWRELKEDYNIQDLDHIDHQLFGIFSTALKFTPQIEVEIVRANGVVTLYPKGVKLLDEAVVNQNLLWLESHPSILKRFEQALAHYMSGDKNKYRNLLDDLRVALEQLLKDVLKNEKPLEKQKTELLPWLKTRGIHKQVINMYGFVA